MTSSAVRAPRRAAVLGLVVVTAYAAFAAVQILVLNPLAAMPGASLGEVYAAVAATGESIGVAGVLVFLAIGPLIAGAVALTARRADATGRGIALAMCGIVMFGAPAYFMASFGPGMALADALMIGGADHSRWSLVLYATSVAAVVVAIALAVGAARGRGMRAARAAG